MDSERPYTDRRTVLETLGAGTVLVLAGCAEDEGADEDEPADDQDETGEDTDGGTVPLDQSTEFPEGEECAVCNMIAAEYPEWNAQLAHEDETRTYFCSSGCMSAYYVEPGRFGGPDSPIAAVWVTDYETGELIDASSAYFVRVTDSDHVDDVMKMNPAPFAERADAEAFVEEFEEYGEEDIITLEEFDRELAMQYRGQFFEDDGGS
jgi:nitrous oxide reductase accessory protein NosL